MKRILSFSIFIMIMVYSYGQKRIYVSPNGSKNATGTLVSPLGSIHDAILLSDKIKSNDTVFIHLLPGTYYLDKPIEITHNDIHPLIIEGDQQNKPIISGGIKISNWEKLPNGWWKTNLQEVTHSGLYFEQLFINGKRGTRARTPNNEWFFAQSASEIIHHRGTGRIPEYATQEIKVKPEDIKTLNAFKQEALADIIGTFLHKWDVTRKHLDFINIDSGLLITSGSGMHTWNPITKGTRYFIENYQEALDNPGEWFLSRNGDLFYIPREGESIDEAEVVAPILQQIVIVNGKASNKVQNVSFRNISFMHTASKTPKDGNEPMQAAALIDAAIQIDFAENINIYNCEVQRTGNYALWFRQDCHKSMVQHSYFNDLGAGGIKIGEFDFRETHEPVTSHIKIDNNIIQHAGKVFPTAVGIAVFFAAHNSITHNEISDLRYTGISLGWIWGYENPNAITTYFDRHDRLQFKTGTFKNTTINNEIAYNHIHHIGWGELSDMGAIYMLGESPHTHVHHNVIHDIYAYDYGGWGLYTDEGSTGILIENNLVYGCKSGAFHQHYGKDNIIKNNIFAFGQYQQVDFTRVENHQSFEFKHNIILADCGKMLFGAWDKANIDMDLNCYWDLRGQFHMLKDMSFSEWKKIKDKHAIVADPLFIDPLKLNFGFKSKKTIRKIGFVPFDYKKAGVYGNQTWIIKAQLANEIENEFKQIILKREPQHSAIYK